MIDSLPGHLAARGPNVCLPSIDSKPLILLVGPNDDTREMLRVVLELWDYQVAEAENSDDSIRLAAYRHPSVILMDTPLPFDDTLNTLSRLHSSDAVGNTPSVVLSGYSEESYRREAWKRGASCFLVKPIDFDILRTYIDTLVRQVPRYGAASSGQ